MEPIDRTGEFYVCYCRERCAYFVQDVNPGPGSKTVFFVHGWPLNHQMYQYQLNVLPEHGFRCIAMDIRGNGQSDKPWTGYTYDRLADDIAIVLEALQVENATLVGFSVGGALSIRYMSRYNGRRISKLALIDAVSPLSLKIKSPLRCTERTSRCSH